MCEIHVDEKSAVFDGLAFCLMRMFTNASKIQNVVTDHNS